jgi:hypothetical protein
MNLIYPSLPYRTEKNRISFYKITQNQQKTSK